MTNQPTRRRRLNARIEWARDDAGVWFLLVDEDGNTETLCLIGLHEAERISRLISLIGPQHVHARSLHERPLP